MGIKISQLPPASQANLTDTLAVVQNGATLGETLQQILTLFTSNLGTVTNLTVTNLTATNFTVTSANLGTPTALNVSSVGGTKSSQETATDNTKPVTASVQQYHPSACQAWAQFNGSSGAITASFNVSSVTANGGGNYSILLTVPFSSSNYGVTTCESGSSSGQLIGSARNFSTTGYQAQFVQGSGTNVGLGATFAFGLQ